MLGAPGWFDSPVSDSMWTNKRKKVPRVRYLKDDVSNTNPFGQTLVVAKHGSCLMAM